MLCIGQADYLQAAAIFIITMGIILLIIEILQLYTQKWNYISEYSNYIDLILFFAACIFSSSAFLECGCPKSWQWQFGIIAVFLAWIDLLLYFRYFPRFGKYDNTSLVFKSTSFCPVFL